MSIPSIHQQRGFSIEQWLKTIFQWELTPLRISLLYLVLGTGSLFFSDVLLVQWVESAALLAQLQAAKGGLEVLLTTGFIYVLTKRSRHSLQQKNASLRELKEERTVLHRVFRHNLRNSMNIVQGSATNLARDLPNPDDNQDIDRILRQSDRVVRLCEHASTIEETTMVDDENHVAIDLPELVDATVTEIRAQYPDVDITTDVPADVTVRGHPQLETALEEAISNAHQHAGGRLTAGRGVSRANPRERGASRRRRRAGDSGHRIRGGRARSENVAHARLWVGHVDDELGTSAIRRSASNSVVRFGRARGVCAAGCQGVMLTGLPDGVLEGRVRNV
ncbi:hypothetical protein [Haloferax larsenii]|uniref:Signal transduction histidine kinase n=1 Tax=Haloferax larsenii TaxID=302484 RepID=A0A1H7R117_HALLR|nr:hypothetical protein SAMN04488691_105231 [Haloferax larsenii]